MVHTRAVQSAHMSETFSRPMELGASGSGATRKGNSGLKVWLVAVAMAAGALTLAPNAHAIERQHHLGLGPSLGILRIDGKSTVSAGVGGALHYAYGLTDQWNLTAEISSVVVAKNQEQDSLASPRNRPATVDHAGVGLAYVIDILRWVPYVGVHVGGYRLAGGTMNSALLVPGASIGAGLDYQFSRQVAVGVAGRQHFMLTQLSTFPSYTTVLLRLEYMWGY